MKTTVNKDGELQQDNTPEVPEDDKASIDSMKAYLLSIYQPAATPREADKRMSTEEIFGATKRIYHNEIFFSRNDLAKWLQQSGFKFWDAGDMRFEWLLKMSGSEYI